MSVTGTAESGPTRVGIAICDLLGGIFSANGILLALEARHRDGRGQRVETSLLESIVSILTWSAGIYFETGITPAPAGNNHPLSSPHGVFKASDRPFNIACGNEAMWKKFVNVIGRPELADDERFRSSGRRLKNRAALTEEINRALASHPAEHWIQLLNREGIPSGPILTIEEMFKHPADCGARDAAEAATSGTRRISDHGIRRQAGIDAGKDHAAAVGRRAH